MNNYEEKQAARKARYEDAAKRAESASNTAYRRVKSIGDMIPFGQPILIGHHSEGRHRADVRRMDNLRSKCVAESQKAEHYAQKAASVGTGGISSDDPEALTKLRIELEGLEKLQEAMKQRNKLIKKNDRAGLAALGLSPEEVERLFTKDCMGCIGYPTYRLANNGANIRRIQKRIVELARNQAREDVEQVCEGYTYREDTTENRVMFEFAGKPSEDIRAILKSNGFKWSPSRGVWVRQLNNAGIYAGKCVKEKI